MRLHEKSAKVRHGDLIHTVDSLAQAALAIAVGRALGHFEAVAIGEDLHGLGECHMVHLLDELEDVAFGAAAEAVKDLHAGVDGKRRRFLGVKRTQAHVALARTGAFEPHLLPDDVNDVDGGLQLPGKVHRKAYFSLKRTAQRVLPIGSASGKRQDKVDLARGRHTGEDAECFDFAVDGDGNARAEAGAIHQPLADAGIEFFQPVDDLAHATRLDFDLLAANNGPEQGGDVDNGHGQRFFDQMASATAEGFMGRRRRRTPAAR